ncbi:MAG: S-adenosylmethionine decarboxylase [Bacillota bacterium]
MKTGFGKHYMADLYLCQNSLWETPENLEIEINNLNHPAGGVNVSWRFDICKPENLRLIGEINDSSFILLQIFPEASFITVDMFSWRPPLDLQPFCESLIDLFAPQVVAAETKLRAEHL